MPRLAWFSPMPPVSSGVAVTSAEVVAALRSAFSIDVFVDEPTAVAHGCPSNPHAPVRSAHDFVWRHRLEPYDLVVYQMGNSSAHDFIWPYLFRYPGLSVLHDAHLHHARAATLLRQGRPDDYRAEFAANHPDANRDLAELAVRGFDTYLYYGWPMTRLLARCSRLVAVHSRQMRAALEAQAPPAVVEAIRLGHGERLGKPRAAAARRSVRRRHDIADDAVVFGLFGGLTPEKRVPQVLRAFAALLPYTPAARLLLVGAPAAHYDVAADVRELGLASRVTLAGYVGDTAFTEYLAACDVSVNLRWPTARETSGPWLRALAAGCPTITMDLWHTSDVPALDPRTWTVLHACPSAGEPPEPVTVTIDVLDEDHSLRLAMRRLAGDAALRDRLATAALEYWDREHSHEAMLADYARVIARALGAAAPDGELPAHLRPAGDGHLRRLLEPFGLSQALFGVLE